MPIARPGKERDPPRRVDQAPAVRDHRAPGRDGRRDTGAEIAERRLQQDDQAARNSVARISSGFTMFGKMCVSMIRRGEQPMIRACNTKSALRSFSTSPRIKRAYGAQPSSEMASTTVVNDGPEGDRQQQRDQDARESQADVGDAHQQAVDPAAQVAAHDAQRGADRRW